MQVIKWALSLVLLAASVYCAILIIIAMFKDSILKGLLGFLCFLYALYYAIFEFKHDNKWVIVIVAILGGGLSLVFLRR